MKRQTLRWKNNAELIELVRILSSYFSNADIGRILGKDRRTIYDIKRMYNIKTPKKADKLPIIVIKPKKFYEEDKND